jgi:hypothetical protein
VYMGVVVVEYPIAYSPGSVSSRRRSVKSSATRFPLTFHDTILTLIARVSTYSCLRSRIWRAIQSWSCSDFVLEEELIEDDAGDAGLS